MLIRMLGIDPSISNVGYAVVDYNVGAAQPFDVVKVGLIETAPGDKKMKVRKSSDDLRRARDLATGINDVIDLYKIKIATAEVPFGAQSARAALSNGVCIGLLASLRVPVIEVNPAEVKLASHGTKTADKEDICRWAVGIAPHPAVGWPTSKAGNDWQIAVGHRWLTKKAEHPADAVAAVAAAVRTEQFKQLIGVLSALNIS